MTYRPRWLRTRVTPQARALRLAPGDVLVARTDIDKLSLDTLNVVKRSLERYFPANDVILTNLDLDVIQTRGQQVVPSAVVPPRPLSPPAPPPVAAGQRTPPDAVPVRYGPL